MDPGNELQFKDGAKQRLGMLTWDATSMAVLPVFFATLERFVAVC